MQSRIPKTILFLTFSVFIATITANAKTKKPVAEFLKSDAVTIERQNPVITQKAIDFLRNRDGEKVKVWVFFTDKQVESKKVFENHASSVALTDRLLKRRAKVNLEEVVFADLPVVNEYIESIVALEGTYRRTSRWQNAASFEINADKLDEIAALPFVAEIRPLGTYKRTEIPGIDLKKDSFGSAKQEADALDYGGAVSQLSQIGIQSMHNLGFHGEGITLAILDTGFRKSHEAFAAAYADNRVLAEHDFIFNDSNTANEPVDNPNQWSHGTLIWSVSGGLHDGDIYGPAYKANFILCKTENYVTETPIEEDYWVAGMEWADSIGVDVITSSLGYIDWYDPSDLDGATAVTTLEANMAASMGIVLCNAAGNYGPGASTLIAPADAHDILTIGAVSSTGSLAGFSSRGPTFDGRIKPEVCARGVSTWSATSSSDASYGGASGTSLSTPLVAGAACLLVQARPNFPPSIIRQAFMETASNASSPNNSFGWGIIDLQAAYNWGAEFLADVTFGSAPQTVQFTANTSLPASAWDWDFGDGGISNEENPAHEYTTPGQYTVSLTIQSPYGDVTNTQINYIEMIGDTVRYELDSAFAGQSLAISVDVVNSQDLESMIVPFKYGNAPLTTLDSVVRGSRTSYFEGFTQVSTDLSNRRYAFQLRADDGGGALPLPPGSGEVLKLYFTIDSFALGGLTAIVDTTSFASTKLSLTTPTTTYTPQSFSGGVMTKDILRGDYDRNFQINVVDLNHLVNFLFRFGPPPVTIQASDNNQDWSIDIIDLNIMVNYIFRLGPPPPTP